MRSRQGKRGAFLAVASGFFATACSLFLDTSGFDSEDSPPSSDGGGEASAPEAARIEDGGAQAEASTSDGGLDCDLLRRDPRTVLCDRFDDRTDPLLGWSEVVKGGTGTLALEGTGASAFLRTTSTQRAAISRAALRKTTGAAGKSITVAANIRYAAVPSISVQAMTIQDTASASNSIYVLHVTPGGLAVFEQSFVGPGKFFQYTPSVSVAANKWARVELGLDFTTSPSTLLMKVDGAPALSRASQVPLVSGDPAVSVGIWYVEPTPAFDLSIDDVVVTVE